MTLDKIEATGLLMANISPMLDGLNDQMAALSQLLSACHDPIESDEDLKGRMALIDKLYSHADSEHHAAACVAELVADRVYEYETKTVSIPLNRMHRLS